MWLKSKKDNMKPMRSTRFPCEGAQVLREREVGKVVDLSNNKERKIIRQLYDDGSEFLCLNGFLSKERGLYFPDFEILKSYQEYYNFKVDESLSDEA